MKESRVLPSTAVTTIADYTAAGGGAALERVEDLGPDGVIDEIARGRVSADEAARASPRVASGPRSAPMRRSSSGQPWS